MKEHVSVAVGRDPVALVTPPQKICLVEVHK